MRLCSMRIAELQQQKPTAQLFQGEYTIFPIFDAGVDVQAREVVPGGDPRAQ